MSNRTPAAIDKSAGRCRIIVARRKKSLDQRTLNMNGKLLRTIGIAIILLPDPTFITDILGLLVIGASFVFFRKRSLSYKKLNGLMIYDLAAKGKEPGGFQPDDRGLKWSPPFHGKDTSGWTDEGTARGILAGPVVHHVLNRQSPAGFNKTIGSFNPETQTYNWRNTAAGRETVVFHSLKKYAVPA